MSSGECNVSVPRNAIAIIGIAGRFPGADTVAQFWRNLCEGTESITRFDEADLEDWFGDETRRSPNYVKARPILQGVDQFDAGFFGMHRREAELTDPQQRIFLECAWEALEDAGYDPATYAGAIGVFAGSSMNTYLLNNVCGERKTIEEFTSNYQVGCYATLVGSSPDFLANRVSYKLDLKGPGITVQTACSTSLVAVIQACQSLLLYQSDMALAGGISITFPQKRGYLHQEGGMVSADGHCRPFDAEASGTIFGSGAGIVLLKRLEQALEDRDHIYAVIRGCGINNDGASKVGFTAPSISGQAAAIEMALAAAEVDARSIGYVECHGTATPLGDPIELAGLTKAFRTGTAERQFCAIGSVKSNIGHLDVAAGVTGLIKTALALKHGLLPPTLHFQRPNPQIDLASTPFYVNTSLAGWQSRGTPRRAGVSAFGVGGTNAHVVLEQPPAIAAQAPQQQSEDSRLLVLSARSGPALDHARSRLAQHLRQHPELELNDVCTTLQTGRRAFKHRCCIPHSNRDEALAGLEDPGSSRRIAAVAADKAPAIAYMFPGQGAQYPQMGHGLYEAEPEFRRHLDTCAEILLPMTGTDIRKLLYPAGSEPARAEELAATAFAQPAIFAVEYALAGLWAHWGVRPAAMIGHSVGELVAATLCGVFALEDALKLIAERGRLMQGLPAGGMMAVRLPEAELAALLPPGVSIAAINGASLCVAAGPFDALDGLEQLVQQRGVTARRLHTSHAFHSPMVDPILEPLRRTIEHMQLSEPVLPWVSCVTGTWIRPEQATSPAYWAGHARQPVRFADGVATLLADGQPLLLEMGPGNTLTTLAAQGQREHKPRICTSLPDAARERADRDHIGATVGKLWTAGVPINWPALQRGPSRRIPLPTYPFERSRYWIDAPLRGAGASGIGSIATSEPCDGTSASLMPLQDPPQGQTTMNQDTAGTPAPGTDERQAQSRTAVFRLLEDLSGESLAGTDPSTNFLELGFDSLFLSQVSQRLQAQFKLKVTFRQLLGEYSSIDALAALLVDSLPPPAAPAAPLSQVAANGQDHRAPAPSPLPASMASSTPSKLECLIRDQMQAMSQLFKQQLEAMQLATRPVDGTAPASPAAPVPAPASLTTGESAEPSQEAPRPSRFQVYSPAQRNSDNGLSAEQRRHIDELTARYTAKTPGSKRSTQAHRPVLADPRAASGFRSEWKEMVYPIVCTRAAGSKIWDIDGNEYIDLVNGYGQTAFGHAPPFVVAAVKQQLDLGFAIGPQAEFAGKVAALFAELTGNERVTFCNTGSEAVMAGLRVARAVTGRSKVVVFNGAYHGQFDEVLVKGLKWSEGVPRSAPVATGIPQSAVDNMIVLDYGSPAALEWIREHAGDLAAVVVETVQSRHPGFLPLSFLRELRQITETSGTALIMDEVVTGFRVHPGGMQAVTGIRADLATYGKVVGGGLPIGILAGKAAFMDALDGGSWNYGDDSYPGVGVTFFAGTFVRHPLALAAVWAVLNHIKEQGPDLQENLTARTAALTASLNDLFQRRGLKTRLETYASFFYFNPHHEHPLAGLLFHHLRLRGIHIHDGFPCFLTTAHSEQDIQCIIDAFDQSLAELQRAGILGQGTPAIAAPAPQGIPLTESQTEIWLSAQNGEEASCAFNESVTLRMQGTLNRPALQRSLDALVARHEALRISFAATGETFSVAPQLAFALPSTDLGDSPAEQAQAGLAALIEREAHMPFDLVHGPLFRGHLVQLAPESHALIFTAHHIICDGWSINIILTELAELYDCFCRGATPELKPAMAFSRYARSRSGDESGHARAEAFWLRQFASPPAPLELPTDRPRAAMRSFRGASHCRHIDASLYQAIKKASARQHCTLFTTLLAAFQTLVGRLAGQDEVTIGIPTAGQSALGDEILVGHCVNFLPLRARWTPATTVGDHLAANSKSVLDAYEHQQYTLGTLVRKLDLPRQANRVPVTEIQFNLERLADRMRASGLDIEVSPNAKAFVNFDLFLNIIEGDSGLRLDCDYNTDLFDQATIDLWLDCYQALLSSFADSAALRLVEAPWLSSTVRTQLDRVNATAVDRPQDLTLPLLIEAQVAANPKAVAVIADGAALSYEELDRSANQLARHLLDRIGAGDTASGRIVGISLRRSADMLIALLATLKAGCAYLPLDPAHPAARRAYALADAQVIALITDHGGPAAASANCVVIDPGSEAAAIRACASTSPAIRRRPEDLAYVIYTSGSTGRPKGVEISHASAVNLLRAMAVRPGLSHGDVLLAVTTVSFDIAALELFLPLSVGATVVIATDEDTTDGFRLMQLIAGSGTTVMQATPATWRLLLEAGFRPAQGFRMMSGGEGLPRELANRLLEGGAELWNMYGPTETTIWSSCARILADDGPIGVGGPIDNTQFYILDQHDQPVPPGTPGQLHIGGAGLARGYHRRPDLTAEKFIASPARLYRTGDLARMTADGNFQILGRLDHQIKLRGFRIELGEIEAVLLSRANLADVAVVLRQDDPAMPRLAAYFVDPPGRIHTAAELRALLTAYLPDYMIPNAWIRLEALPRTPNGKLDRASLPAPDQVDAVERKPTAPRTGLEQALVKIWEEVLHAEPIGTDDDLFELGADSIHLFQITARATRQGIRVSAKLLIRHRTIARLAAHLEQAGAGDPDDRMGTVVLPINSARAEASRN
jgi:amino acid adenylation domain-containing protein